MNILLSLWQSQNGYKTQRGLDGLKITALMIMAFCAMGMQHDQAAIAASAIVGGFSALVTVVGVIHAWIKAHRNFKIQSMTPEKTIALAAKIVDLFSKIKEAQPATAQQPAASEKAPTAPQA